MYGIPCLCVDVGLTFVKIVAVGGVITMAEVARSGMYNPDERYRYQFALEPQKPIDAIIWNPENIIKTLITEKQVFDFRLKEIIQECIVNNPTYLKRASETHYVCVYCSTNIQGTWSSQECIVLFFPG